MRSNKVEIDGHKFDSQMEANIYFEFKVNPDVAILELHPQFELQPKFKKGKKSHRAIKYTADFLIEEKGKRWVVDVKSKGSMLANSKSYPMRIKMLLFKYPDINFREIIFNGKRRETKEY